MAFGARRGFALALVVTGILVVVPTAGAQVLPATPNPLPGSAFQGGDGDQAPESEWIDWETLQGEGRVLHSPDPIPDIALEGHNLTPGDWHFATYGGGVSPPASNILDLWFSLDAVDPNTFLYLAFARQQGGMASNYLAFELNRDGDFWENRRGARVPCRHDDDLLVTFVPTGNRVSMLVRRWRTGTDDYDPLTGCAQSGSMDAADVEPNEDVQGAVNASQFSNSLGGTLPAFTQYQFGETAMNLGRVLESAVGSSCGAFTSVWMNSKSSDSDNASMKDFVDPLPINARRCSAAGTKWHDYDADGRRDPGEPGLAGFRIYADLNGNREFDPQGPGERGEPFAITDEHGDYVIDGIRESGQYTLREERTAAAPEGRWNCSYPRRRCAHTVDADANPFAEGRDFGNWRPARVTLTKKLDPPGDPGRFNLSVGRRTLPAAGHLDSRTFRIRPGRRRVSETPAAGADPADYDSSVACGAVSERARRLRGATSTTVRLLSGQRVECVFVNVRRGDRSVTIDKVAPAFATHGDTIRYELVVTNTGSVPFAAGDVSVRDRRCDAAPEVVERLDENGAPDSSPAILNPWDTWIYVCDRATRPLEDPDDCQPTPVTNTGRVSVPGAGDRDRERTLLTCPPERQRPLVEIHKVGPQTAVAGTALRYVFYVRNIGDISFDEGDVHVSDDACDAAPEVVARFDETGAPDDSTGQLDPNDVWVYSCTNTTPDPGADCQPSVVTNTGFVRATSPGRFSDDDSDSFETPLTCPPGPPGPPAPALELPVPVLPPGVVPSARPPRLPDAGLAGRASLRPLRGCLRRGSRVIVRGRRIASISVRVRGRRVGGLRVRALRRRAIIRVVRNLPPGRHRATAVVRFQRGSATPTARLTRVVRVCAPPRPPRVTG